MPVTRASFVLAAAALLPACSWFWSDRNARYALCSDADAAAAWQSAQEALARGADAEALPLLQRTVARCPDFVRAHLAYQDAALRAGGTPRTTMLAWYRGLGGSSPVADYVKARLMETSYDQGQALRAILARDPAFAWAHLSMGRLSRRQGQLLAAIDSFERALANDPGLHEAVLERAQVLAEVGRDEEAAVGYEDYLARVPGDDAAKRAYIALLLYRLSRVERAVELLDDLGARFPGDRELSMHRAAAQWAAHDPRAAVRTYLDVLAAHPDEARAALNIGLLYYDVLPSGPVDRRIFWPRARAAFHRFLQTSQAMDGHEQFERTFAVPYRLEVIAEQLGEEPPRTEPVGLDELQLPSD